MNIKRTGALVALLVALTSAGTTPAGASGAVVTGGVDAPQGAPGKSLRAASNEAITRSEVLTRAQSWLRDRVPYNQGRSWTNEYGTYRQDCSGYVSMAWHLDSSYVTWTLPPLMDVIGWGDLKPGDALWKDTNHVDGHIALFIRWADDAHTMPVVWEEYSEPFTAEERTWSSSWARNFTPMRYRNIVDDAGPALGDEGIAASASYRYGHQEHMFSKGADGALLHSYNTGEAIESESFPAELAGEPVAYVAGDQQHVFGRLADNTIGHWYWYPTDDQPHFEQWGADDIAGNPTGYAFGDQQHVYARGTDGKLKHLYWTPDTGVVEETQSQDVVGDPVAYVWGDQQHVFGRTPAGELGHWYWTPSDNDPNYVSWGGRLAGDPAGYAFGDQQHVFARDTGGKLVHFYWAVGEDVTVEPLGADIAGDPIAYVWNDQQHVFARTPGNELGHWWWTPADNAPQYVSWGGDLATDPTGFATATQQNVYGRAADGTLAHWYWNTEMAAPDHETWGQ
ncbi:hypothetical protein [Amycolatopsis sp. NPDC003861]